jgi:hypothetical protein
VFKLYVMPIYIHELRIVRSRETMVAKVSLYKTYTKTEKIYTKISITLPNGHKLGIPNGHNIDQMAII